MDTGAVPFIVDAPMHSLNAGVTFRAEALIKASASSTHLIIAESDEDEFAHGTPTMPDMYVHPIQDGDSGLAKVHLVVANPSDTEYVTIRKGRPYARLTQVTPYSDDQASDEDIATASLTQSAPSAIAASLKKLTDEGVLDDLAEDDPRPCTINQPIRLSRWRIKGSHS